MDFLATIHINTILAFTFAEQIKTTQIAVGRVEGGGLEKISKHVFILLLQTLIKRQYKTDTAKVVALLAVNI